MLFLFFGGEGVNTWLERSPGQFAEQSVEHLVFLVDPGGVGAVVVLFSAKQRQVPRPEDRNKVCKMCGTSHSD